MSRSRSGLAAVLALAATAAFAAEPAPRAAVIVGSNAPGPGRLALRHAHRDAERIAEVLTTVGQFPRDHVHLLRDPAPAEVLAALERETAALAGRPGGMLFFYYSGHADGTAFWSGGAALSLASLKSALDRPEVVVRVGVIDACQGGGWTRAKGLVPEAPFEVPVPRLLESEGSALIASSSGDESAHESDSLAGSFFTVHLAAGLRGAADENRDGRVTLTEAFEYARSQTIRDTARRAREPQHPSYALNLRGRQDVTLAQLEASRSSLAIEQDHGPIELVHLASGLRLLELPPGPRAVKLAVPPGRYVVRTVQADGVRAREVSVPRDGEAQVREHDLVLVGSERLVVKGTERVFAPSTPPDGHGEVAVQFTVPRMQETNSPWYVQVGDGFVADVWKREYSDSVVVLDGRIAISDRLTWRIGTLSFAWRFGDPDELEIVPFGGLLSWNHDVRNETFRAIRLGGGVGWRSPAGPGFLVGNAGLAAIFDPVRPEPVWGTALELRAALGWGFSLGETADVHLAAGFQGQAYPWSRIQTGGTPPSFPRTSDGAFYLGSIQELGLASIPLVRLHLRRAFALDVHVQYGISSRNYFGTSVGLSKRL